jgi:hypothetical protein
VHRISGFDEKKSSFELDSDSIDRIDERKKDLLAFGILFSKDCFIIFSMPILNKTRQSLECRIDFNNE